MGFVAREAVAARATSYASPMWSQLLELDFDDFCGLSELMEALAVWGACFSSSPTGCVNVPLTLIS